MVLAASSLTTETTSAVTAWPMFRFDAAHTGWNPSERTISRSNVANLVPVWTGATPTAIQLSSPAVAGGTIFVGGSAMGGIHAFDTSGQLLWTVPFSSVDSSPAAAARRAFVTGNDRALHAFAAETGDELWVTSLGAGFLSSPTVVGSTVFVGGALAYALRAKDGSVLWSAPTAVGVINASPTVANNTVFLGAGAAVYAFDAATGASVWTTPVLNQVESSAAVVDGALYLGTKETPGGRVYALDVQTGSVLWSRHFEGEISSSPAVWNGRVYVGSWDHYVYCLDAATGQTVWKVRTGDIVGSSPAVANRVVYVGSSDERLYAIDAVRGTVLWSYQTGGNIQSSPSIVNGRVYVGSWDGLLYAFGLGSAD
jgi:outer membrane protein assembly factor BamB